MLNFKDFNEQQLAEKRRSERVGIAKTKELEFGHTAGKAYIQSLKEKGEDLGRYGITMTKLPKVGINPGSRYNTPIGVYFYPARYYLKRSELPFEHDANYINVIKFKDGAKILDLGVIEEEDLDTLVSKLSKIYPPEKVQQYYTESLTEAQVLTPAGAFWYITFKLSDNNSKTWNKIFRQLGYDIVIDTTGEGIIYETETTQGFLVDPTKAVVVKRFDNFKPKKQSEG